MNISKQYQKGTGDTKGLMALGRSGAKGKEAYKKITGKEFDEKMMEYGRKLMERGQKIMAMGANMGQSSDPERGVNEMTMGEKIYQDGTGQMGEFQAGQMVREGRGPSEEALTREMFAQQRLGFEGLPVAPMTKEGEIYESDPQVRKQVLEMRRRGHVGQGPSQQMEMKRMAYDDQMRELDKAYADYFSRRSVVEPRMPQYSFQEGPGGEGGSLVIRGGQSDIKKRTMGGRNQMYVR